MIKIITAIGNTNLNNQLKKYEEFRVIGNDIFYKEGVFELLENNKDIDYIILGELINKDNDYFIEKIKEINNKIKIIFIINGKNKDLENELYKRGINDIFFEDENIDNIINYLKSKNIEYLNIELRKEINNLKSIILENEKINNKNNKKLSIYFSGTNGIGKTTACVIFANALKKHNKILIMDLNYLNPQIGNIYNKKINYSEINENNLESLIFKVENNVDIFIGFDILKNYRKINMSIFYNKMEELKNKYNYIFIDSGHEEFTELNLFNQVDKILLLSGIKDIDLNKTKNIISKFENKQEIHEKINIVFYRINLIEFIRIIFNKKIFSNLLNYKDIGFIKNKIFINNNLTKEKNIINKTLIKKIIKNI